MRTHDWSSMLAIARRTALSWRAPTEKQAPAFVTAVTNPCW